jgi:fatty-acyl-CoA synthase
VPAPETIADLIHLRAQEDRPALRFDDQRWTWREVAQEMESRARLLTALVPHDPPHVGVLLDNVPEFLFLLGGAALSGRVLVGLNDTRRGDELARDIRHTDCQVVITDESRAALLDGLDLGAAAGRVHRIDDAAYAEAIYQSREVEVVQPKPDDLYLLLFTPARVGHRRPCGLRTREPSADRKAWAFEPTTSSTARCRCSTATR